MAYITSEDRLSNRLIQYENHINEICEKIRASEMTKAEASHWIWIIEDEALQFRDGMPGNPDFQNEVHDRLKRIENKAFVAKTVARANYRKNEKTQLRDAYGWIGSVIYFFLKLFGKM